MGLELSLYINLQPESKIILLSSYILIHVTFTQNSNYRCHMTTLIACMKCKKSVPFFRQQISFVTRARHCTKTGVSSILLREASNKFIKGFIFNSSLASQRIYLLDSYTCPQSHCSFIDHTETEN